MVRWAISGAVMASFGCGPPKGDVAAESGGSASSASVTGTPAASSSSASGSSGETAGPAPSSSVAGTDTLEGIDATGETEACNGHVQLCDRGYDEVVFATTHNSVAATDDGFSPLTANHVHGIEQQLTDGVRGLLLDVTYDADGVTALCHGRCSLGSRPHVEVMAALADFLDANPREVVTIIYQDSVDPADVEADYVATGLDARVFVHGDGDPWPTLGEMIDADTRLVVTAESGGPPPAWYHHVWDVAWDTPYSFTSPDEFSCALNRGAADNDLMLLNHWLSTEAGLPAPSQAATANAFQLLHGRAIECAEAAGRAPTFVAVDFYETGDLFDVVDALNGV